MSDVERVTPKGSLPTWLVEWVKNVPESPIGDCLSEKQFRLYAAGYLEGEELKTVETHLDSCPACNQEMIELLDGAQVIENLVRSNDIWDAMSKAARENVRSLLAELSSSLALLAKPPEQAKENSQHMRLMTHEIRAAARDSSSKTIVKDDWRARIKVEADTLLVRILGPTESEGLGFALEAKENRAFAFMRTPQNERLPEITLRIPYNRMPPEGLSILPPEDKSEPNES